MQPSFGQLAGPIWRSVLVGRQEAAVLLTVASFCECQAGRYACTPGVAAMARSVRLSPSTLMPAVARLEDRGLLERSRKRRSTVFALRTRPVLNLERDSEPLYGQSGGRR